MSPPLAYFLTWTGHGTRLHGDERGSVCRYPNRIGALAQPPDLRREEFAAELSKGSPFVMDTGARSMVDATIRRHCELRGWKLLALNVRTTHVHVVVVATGVSPERVMEQFKAWSTRRLREFGLVRADQKLWTEHGSTRWINHEEGLRAAVDYVLNHQ